MNTQDDRTPDTSTRADGRQTTPAESPAAPDTRPGLDVTDTQPVTSSGATITYPALPPQYTLDDGQTAGPASEDATAAAAPATVAAAALDRPRRIRRPLRVRTLVFGLVMLAISVVSLVALTTDVHVDSGVVGLGLLIGAGAALVAGGVAAAMREARGGPGAAR